MFSLYRKLLHPIDEPGNIHAIDQALNPLSIQSNVRATVVVPFDVFRACFGCRSRVNGLNLSAGLVRGPQAESVRSLE